MLGETPAKRPYKKDTTTPLLNNPQNFFPKLLTDGIDTATIAGVTATPAFWTAGTNGPGDSWPLSASVAHCEQRPRHCRMDGRMDVRMPEALCELVGGRFDGAILHVELIGADGIPNVYPMIRLKSECFIHGYVSAAPYSESDLLTRLYHVAVHSRSDRTSAKD